MNLCAKNIAIAASFSLVSTALACSGPGGGGGPFFPPPDATGDTAVGGDTGGNVSDATPDEVTPVRDCTGAGGVTVSGLFNVSQGFAFDSASVTLEHKMDVDAFEDGCLTLLRIDLGKGFGCKLVVEAGGSVADGGGLRVQRLALAADSQCPGFPDDSEGEYDDMSAMNVALVVPDAYEVPDENAPTSCLGMNVEVRLEGLLKDGFGRSLTIAPTTLRVTGEMTSNGSTTAQCPCVAQCGDRDCGGDTCGFSCGACGEGDRCETTTGQCVCQPECGGRECGDDGCGGSCGACAGNETCGGGQCIACQPSCGGRECGDDGCGGSCGSCAQGDLCQGGSCECQPDCSGPGGEQAECGDDGCGGSCGTCSEGSCEAGQCVVVTVEPECGDLACDPGEETTCPTDCLSLVCNDICETLDLFLCPTDCD